MSSRYQAGIVLPGYNALKVANAPTIGTATAGSSQVSVAFTAPACVGGGAISSYTAYANCGVYRASGASSPLVVTGLTNGTAYTFKVIATNAYGPSYPSAASASVTPILPVGQQAYTTAGTFLWVAPAGVTKVSVVAVGGGGGGHSANVFNAGGGGGLGYRNNICVTPGSSYCVVVGAAGTKSASSPTSGGNSYFVSIGSTSGYGGGAGPLGACGVGGAGGIYAGNGGGNGGNGGYACNCGGGGSLGGGGGAGGYVGTGGAGGSNNASGANGAGGGGGGGGGGFAGGCVGLGGQGANGTGGASAGGVGSCFAAKGGAGSSGSCGAGQAAKAGAVRIIWPGNTRSFPSTCTGNL